MNTEALLDLMPAEFADDFRNTFAQMEIAEEEIARIRRRYPRRSDYLNKEGFLLCMPSEVIRLAGGWSYRAHCREILERLAADEDTRKPTSAELAVLFSAMSLKCPLNPTGAGLYARHFLTAAARVGHPIDRELSAQLRELEDRLDPALTEPLERGAMRKLQEKDRMPGKRERRAQQLALDPTS